MKYSIVTWAGDDGRLVVNSKCRISKLKFRDRPQLPASVGVVAVYLEVCKQILVDLFVLFQGHSEDAILDS